MTLGVVYGRNMMTLSRSTMTAGSFMVTAVSTAIYSSRNNMVLFQ